MTIAAIVIATPDDFGGAADDRTKVMRARQNVWVELGFFWARLGKNRLLVLVKGKTEIPSDLQGLLFFNFNEPSETSSEIFRFVDNLGKAEPDELTEIVRASSDPFRRMIDYELVVEQAEKRLVTTGTGMANIRQGLGPLFSKLRDNPDFQMDFIVLDKEFLKKNSKIFNEVYRKSLYNEIVIFEKSLQELVEINQSSSRVTLWRFPHPIFFTVSIGDPGLWGSVMVVESILPLGDSHNLNRPRFVLKKRSSNGLYDRYWAAVKIMFEISKKQ